MTRTSQAERIRNAPTLKETRSLPKGWRKVHFGDVLQKALRKALLKYSLHTDQDLFDWAYGYIRQYY